MIVDLCILALLGGITYALMSEGLWGSALMFFNVLFASLITFNFYEPLAQVLIDNASSMANYADSLSMMVIFVVSLLLLRLATESLSASMVRFPTPIYHLGRIVFGFGGAVLMIAVLLLGFQASPVQKKMLGVWNYRYKPTVFMSERFDKDFLAFFQYTSGYTFPRNGKGGADPQREFPSKPMLFDPGAMWMIDHEQARPYGTGNVLDDPADPNATTPPPTTDNNKPK